MSNYYNGTSAYKINDFDYVTENIHNTGVKEKIETRRVVRLSKKAAFLSRVRMAVALLSVFGVALGILFTNAVIIEKSSAVNDMQAQLNALTEANNQTVLDIERSLDLKKIEEIAIGELGMKHPDKYQVVYVNVEQNNYGEIGSGDDQKGFGGTMVAMGKGAQQIVEYMN